jgi:hypothetical protein
MDKPSGNLPGGFYFLVSSAGLGQPLADENIAPTVSSEIALIPLF